MPERISPNIDDLTQQLAEQLATRRCRLVLAESCTGGLVSASLARVPGISDWLCGSAVTYRQATKSQWLGVLPTDLEQYTAVSQQVAEQMAAGVLSWTDEADVAASVTGYLGPSSPTGQDGLIFVGLCRRLPDRSSDSPHSIRHQLQCSPRIARQHEAAAFVLQSVLEYL
jgi:PncC family amidohydrolase